jgi:hypothetical protein
MRRTRWRLFEREPNDFIDLVVGHGRRRAGPGFIVEPLDPLLDESTTPNTDGLT